MLIHVAVFPLHCRIWPVVPELINAVVPAPDCIGICPRPPPAILIAAVAVATVPLIVPPTYKEPPTPTPPATCNAPVLVEIDTVVFVIVKIPL